MLPRRIGAPLVFLLLLSAPCLSHAGMITGLASVSAGPENGGSLTGLSADALALHATMGLPGDVTFTFDVDPDGTTRAYDLTLRLNFAPDFPAPEVTVDFLASGSTIGPYHLVADGDAFVFTAVYRVPDPGDAPTSLTLRVTGVYGTPEPTSLSLAGIGVVGLLGLGLRRRMSLSPRSG